MNRRPWLLLAAAVAALGFAPATSVAETVEAGEYRRMITSCREELTRGKDTPACVRLLAVAEVVLPDGQSVAVRNEPLNSDMEQIRTGTAEQRKTRRESAVERLATLEQLVAERPVAVDGPTEPAMQVQEILAGDEFRRAFADDEQQAWWRQRWNRFWAAVSRFLELLFPLPTAGAGGWAGVGRASLYILSFLAVVAGLISLWLLLTSSRSRARMQAAPRGVAEEEDGTPPTGAPLAEAEERARSGDYRGALRLTYRACLQRLAGAGLLVLEEQRTNWDYQRALRGRAPDTANALLPVTKDFERIWYGKNPASHVEYERALAVYETLPKSTARSAGSRRDPTNASGSRGATDDGSPGGATS